jgi:general secretion pathway protein D
MIKTKPLFFGLLLLLQLTVHSVQADSLISEIEYADTQLIDVIRTLSELSDSNIIATPEATKKQVTIHLKNVSVVDAVKSICRISDLWYRFDEDTNTYRIMTREEYSRDLIVRESEHIEVYTLLNANVQIVAEAIADLYGQRVLLSLGREPGETSLSGSSNSGGNSSGRSSAVRNSRSLSGGSRGSTVNSLVTSGSQLEDSNLTIDQLSLIAEQNALLNSGNVVDSATLQQVTVQAQPIYVTVNNEHNMIIVRTDDMGVIESITNLVKKMDKPIPQVMLEMKILSVLLGEDFNSIFNFQIQPVGSNQSVDPILLGNNGLLNSGTFVYEFLNSRLRANIEFLESNNRLKVLSNPMVVASNHRETELFIGEEAVLTRGFTFRGATIANGVVVSPSYVETETELEEVGITLRLTPRINADGTVELDIEQESSTIKDGGGTIPIVDNDGNALELTIDTVDTSSLTGTVMAKDGLTVAVGGLIRTTKNNQRRQVPVLGEIPVVGRLFRSDIESEEQSETVLLITPRIINNPEQSENIRQSNNQFYEGFNREFPDPPALPNQFIDKDPRAEITAGSPAQQRQQLYMQMSEYAAETIRRPEIERVRSDVYSPVDVISVAAGIFNDPRVKTVPNASWQRGGLYVTAVTLHNRSNDVVNIDYTAINGEWLASTVETEALDPAVTSGSTTYMYLISAFPFNDVVSSFTQ